MRNNHRSAFTEGVIASQTTQHRHIGDGSNIGILPYTSIHQVLDQRCDDTQNHTAYDAHRQIQLHIRRTRCGRRICLLHYRKIDGRNYLVSLIRVDGGSNLFLKTLGNRISNTRCNLWIYVLHRDVYQHGVARIGGRNGRCQFLNGGFQAQIIDYWLQYRFCFDQLRISLNLAVDVAST